MFKKWLAALSLGLLAATAAAPAQAAEATFFERYADMFEAQTFHQQQEGGKRGTIWVGGEYRQSSFPVGFGDLEVDTQFYRGGVGYATDRWQLGFTIGNENRDEEDFGDEDFLVWDIHGKAVLWRSKDRRTNVSTVFQYRDYEDVSRIDALLAVDHRVFRDLTATINAGYGRLDFDDDDEIDDFVGAVGLVWHPSAWPRFFLSANYIINNDVDVLKSFAGTDKDNYSVKAGYRVGRNLLVTAGGGKRETFIVGLHGVFQ